MDLTSLYYFSELAKTLNITKTAERLYISQQTLSNHIARMEEYFDMPLFYRSPSLSLTPAGELVLSFSHLVGREHSNLKDMLADMKRQECGVLRIGASAVRIYDLLPYVLPRFTQRYPGVDIQFNSESTRKAMAMLLDGSLDFVLSVFYEKNPNLIVRRLTGEPVYLCVSDKLLRQYYGEEAEALKRKSEHGARIADFAKLPFCMVYNNHMGEMISKCFQEANVTPWVHMSSEKTIVRASISYEGFAASFISQIYLREQQPMIPQDINILPVLYQDQPLSLDVFLIRRKDRYLAQYSKFFFSLLYEHYSEAAQIRLDHIV